MVKRVFSSLRQSVFSAPKERKGCKATLAVQLLCACLPRVVDRSLGWLVGIHMFGWNYCQAKPALELPLHWDTMYIMSHYPTAAHFSYTATTLQRWALALDVFLLPQIQNWSKKRIQHCVY